LKLQKARMMRILLLPMVGLLLLAHMPAIAADCPGNPKSLGTGRVLAVDPATTPAVGRKQFPVTLPLAPKEVVLTFDDGPWPGTTEQALVALRRECVRASFFMLGRNVAAHPALARRVFAEGHTVAHHTFAHPLLNRMSVAHAESEIDRGMRAVDMAVYGQASAKPKTPFFRFPGLASSPALLELLARRGITVFSADLWPGDWNPMTLGHARELLLKRLAQTGGGIVLLHDIQAKTATMLPQLLRDLKGRDYRIVHIVPAAAQ
jgi:peptidoglycan/xylan/chitin deacetylase (PgdA/CDA1 family)